MKFSELLEIVQDLPVFTSGFLISGKKNPNSIRRQLFRWVKSGKLIHLKRGLYKLSPPYEITPPHPFLIANAMRKGSYISTYSALEYYGLIPETIPKTTSVSPGNPSIFAGTFEFNNLAKHLFFGYRQIEIIHKQNVFIATPEKAILDLVHLTAGSDSFEYLNGLRLQNLKILDLELFHDYVERSGKPKWFRAYSLISQLFKEQFSDFQEMES